MGAFSFLNGGQHAVADIDKRKARPLSTALKGTTP
jgi:hypothetical protein